MTTVFENPPVNEVVIATYFNSSIPDFRSEHLGLLWHRMRDDFPTVRQQPPLGPPESSGLDISAEEIFPMPRYWFISQDESRLVQIQKNAFIFNWRRRGSNRYPGYRSAIKPEFDKYYHLVDDFIRTEFRVSRRAIVQCELTYINTVERCEFWAGPEDTARVVPSFCIPTPGTDVTAPVGFNCNYLYEFEGNSKLSVGIRDARRPQESDSPVLIIEIKMGEPQEQGTKFQADEWFQIAHDRITRCFVDLTSKDIRDKYWASEEQE